MYIIHVHVHYMCCVQIDDELFNPDYTVVDRVLDVATQTEVNGEVTNTQHSIHVAGSHMTLCVGTPVYYITVVYKDIQLKKSSSPPPGCGPLSSEVEVSALRGQHMGAGGMYVQCKCVQCCTVV